MNNQDCKRYLEKIQSLGIKFGLDNVREILSAFQQPHQKFPSVLVAGTNGKGSVCAFLTRILTLHGLRVGLFTSPHLIRAEERLRIGDRLIPRRVFCRLLTRLRDKIEELIDEKRLLNPPTYFEHLCCLAFLYFAEEKLDIAVLEVGMGGRFDATNVVTPLVSVITTISAEHQKFLGRTLSQIAYEKAGIIKPGIPVVCGVEKPQAYETIKKRAEELGAPFLGVFDQNGCFTRQKTEGGYIFHWVVEGEAYSYQPSLRGEHQGRNAAVAIAACRAIDRHWRGLEKEKIVQGIQTTRWEGRLEVLSPKPLVLLDGAHNEEGAEALRDYIREFVSPPLYIVYAAMRDKNVRKVADILFPLADKIILTRFPYFRAAQPEELREKVFRYKDRIICEPNVEQALRRAMEMAGPEGTVLVAGSLFLIGEIKKIRPSSRMFAALPQ
jgi:dihydrofolate synthase/folylpolyglutamate synthase